MERGEQPGRGFGGIAGFAEVDRCGRARGRRRSEGEQGFPGANFDRVEAQRADRGLGAAINDRLRRAAAPRPP